MQSGKHLHTKPDQRYNEITFLEISVNALIFICNGKDRGSRLGSIVNLI